VVGGSNPPVPTKQTQHLVGFFSFTRSVVACLLGSMDII
jgi:hypothetical protein